MRGLNWDRLAAASGFGFVALLIVSMFVPGEAPKAGDSTGQIVSYFLSNRKEVLIAGILSGIALVLFLWFLGTLAQRLREAGEHRLATTALGGGFVAAGLGIVGTLMSSALAYRIALDVGGGVTRGLYELQLMCFTFIAFPLFVLAAATAIASWRARIFPEWYAPLGLVGAVLMGVGGITVARTGFIAPDGGYAMIALIAFLVWTVLTSGLLYMYGEARARAHHGAPLPVV